MIDTDYETIDTRRCDYCGVWREHCQCRRCQDCESLAMASSDYCEEHNTKAGEAQEGILWAQVDMEELRKAEQRTSESIEHARRQRGVAQ